MPDNQRTQLMQASRSCELEPAEEAATLESAVHSWMAAQKAFKAAPIADARRLREAQAILNKLTVERFDRLFASLAALGVDEHAEALAKLLHASATRYPAYIP